MCWTSFRNSVAPDVERAGGWSQTTPALPAPLSPVSPHPLPPPTPLFFVEVPLPVDVCGPHSESDWETPKHETGPRERKQVRIPGLQCLVIFSILALM